MRYIQRISWNFKYFIACICLCLFCLSTEAAYYIVEITDRHLYGPGPFPDQKLKAAWIRNLELHDFLDGHVKGFNNLELEPNVSGESLQGKKIDGLMSDGTLINEHIDMSNAVIMGGQFNLLLAAVFGGPNEGDTFFYTDENYNWWIKDDIAIDPGFAAGVIKIDDFTFSTGPRIIPSSLQTELGYPGGTNQIGSIEAGRVALGQLGDDNGDGYLDGVFNAIGRFPMKSIFLPGAPFVQLFKFKSDIPITAGDAALLSLASARTYLKLSKELMEKDSKHQDIATMKDKMVERVNMAHQHVLRTVQKSDCDSYCTALDGVSKSISNISSIKQDKLQGLIDKAYNAILEFHKSRKGNV